MHNEPTLQPAREKPLPNTDTITSTTVPIVPHINGNGAVPENTTRTPLHEAAAGGDETKVETLLSAGADRNAKESVHGNTPLHEAAWKGYSRCVKLLCALPKTKPTASAKGLSIDLLKDATKIKHALHDTKGALHSALLGTRNFGGFSALHLAAQNGHNQSCREILLAGADPDVQNNYGDTPLHTACRYGHAGAIRILLSAKCDFERINLNGDTALHIACAMGRRKLTRILLESGCRQDTKNAQEETPRDIAQRKNLVEIINILNTPIDLSARRSRERSSSSSQHQRNKPEGHTNGGVHHKSSPHEPPNPAERRSRSKDETGRKSGRRSNSNDEAAATRADAIDPKHWSPYGCHYFPDPRNFPSPKLETLPKEPLGNGEQYFLDLAGNIRKGPVGVGNTCYCAPFFKHLEQRMNQNRRSIRKYVHRATEKLDSRMTALAMRTDDQIEELTKSMIASRVQCENKRLHLEQWLKRGIAERSTTTATSGGLEHSNSKTKKDEANTNTLTRCRSLELLDDHDTMLLATGVSVLDDQLRKSSTPTRQLFSRSIDFLDAATNGDSDHGHHGVHRQQQQQQQELESHLRLLQYAAVGGHQSDALDSSNNSNMKNHSESAETPPIPDGASIRISRRPRSSSMSGRDSYSYSSDNNKDNDREKPPRHVPNGTHEPKLLKKRTLPTMPTSSTPTSAISSNGGSGAAVAAAGTAKSEKAKVTERLEELLSKTKKILELEKMTKGGGSGVVGTSPLIGSHPNTAIAPTTTDNRYILALDKLRDIHHYEPSAGAGGAKPSSGRSARDSPGYDIAQEMEKITKSLLPAAPVSPEIAKDITTRKERPTTVLYASSYQQQQQQPPPHPHRRTTPQDSSPLSTTPLSTMSPSSSLLGGQMAPARCSPFASDRQHHLASTNFMEEHGPCDEQNVSVAMGALMNGFYSNSCFEDAPPSSSNTTVKSAGPRQQHPATDDSELEQEDEADEDGEDDDDVDEDEHDQEEAKEQEDDEDDREAEEEEASDVSDRCDLSAMANLAELKELKSRILNGTNWRSQVLQKSVQELLRSGEGADTGAASQDQDPCQAGGETNRVKYIISKLQQSGGTSSGDLAIRTQHHHQVPPMARCEDFSDTSSEEEDEEEDVEDVEEPEARQVPDDDEDCVDGPPIPIPIPVNGVPDQEKPSAIGIGTAKSLIQLYEQSASATSANGGAIGKSAVGPNGGPFANVPKDAYFHELPPRKLLLLPPPELSSMSGLTSRVHQTARSRNPLPSYLLQDGAGELFQQQPSDMLDHPQGPSGGYAQQQSYFDEQQQQQQLTFQSHHPLPQHRTPAISSYPIPADGFLPPVGLPTPVNHHHPHGHMHIHQQQQQQEKLLSARKYINPSSAVSLASTGTPSPEFPLYQHHHQQQIASTISAQPTYPSAGTASVIGGHSHAMMTMMAAAAAAAGRKSVDQLSSNGEDSGYVSGKVSEIHIPSGGASPLLPATASNVLIIPPPVPSSSSSSSPKHFLPYSHHHHPLVTSMHHRNGTPPLHHGSVVTSIVPPPVGSSGPAAAGLHPTTGQTTAQLHAAVEQKQQALYKLGASSLV